MPSSAPSLAAVSEVPIRHAVPLCVDLDGTLVKNDTLVDSCLVAARRKPILLLQMPLWVLGGKSGFKAALSQEVTLDAESLPYNQELLDYLRSQRDAGRSLYLVTGASSRTANAVADHLGLFDEILSSNAHVNLTGVRKFRALEQRFGNAAFDYIGNSLDDIPALAGARSAILVHPSRRVKLIAKRKHIRIDRVFEAPHDFFTTLLSLIRVKQWSKNVLIFLPLLLAHQVQHLDKLRQGLFAFFAFSFAASAGYIINDMLDVEADRKHPRKRTRPFASGQFSPRMGLILVMVLLGCATAAAIPLPARFAPFLLIYFVVSVSYSLFFKRMALIDVLILASLYTIRIFCGSVATDVPLSAWMQSFSLFLFLSLAIVKRYSELHNLRAEHSTVQNGRGYHVGDIEQIRSFGTASSYAAVVVFVLYVNSPDVQALYKHRSVLWLVTPLIIYWLNRVWLLAHRGELDDDPVLFAIHDRVSLLIGFLAAAIVLLGAR